MVLSNSEFERQFAAASKRGNGRLAKQPVAMTVRYDRRLRKIVINLSNGCTLLVPPELAQGLSEASARELATAKILGPGTTIGWPKLDVQLSVAGLLAGNFGTAAWMDEQQRAASESPAPRLAKKRRAIKAKR
jgi:Protein of unknown function (DUF2442)